jgi:signal transduction histidine kinase
MTVAPGQPWSLRNRLIAITIAATLSVWLCGLLAMVWVATEQSDKLHDEHLADMARAVLRFAAHELEEIRNDPALAGGNVHSASSQTLGSRYSYQIWSRGDDAGELLLRSANAPADRPLAAPGQVGFGHFDSAGQRFCTFVERSYDAAMEIHAADSEDLRPRLVAPFTPGLFAAFASALILMALFSWLALRRAMRPIDALAQQVVDRSASDLHAVELADPPRELTPVAGAVNGLLRRVDEALARERNFVAVAAHELRTPLAGLRTMTQVAQRARDDGERGAAFDGILQGVDRCAHMVDQLLALATADSAAADPDALEPVDLSAVVDQVMRDHSAEAALRSVSVSAAIAAPALRARRYSMHMLLSNLLGNSLRYTPPGGRVVIEAHMADDGIEVTVDDSGRGIPLAERERVFERFRRLRPDEPGGVGLGLSIVQSVARNHHAAVTLLDSPLGGLRVRVKFARQA